MKLKERYYIFHRIKSMTNSNPFQNAYFEQVVDFPIVICRECSLLVPRSHPSIPRRLWELSSSPTCSEASRSEDESSPESDWMDDDELDPELDPKPDVELEPTPDQAPISILLLSPI
uniref:Uncharacterized protein n=1 Tax=Talaromyces marneffei PM1 TaxID=1077442 RepID=A0A093ULF1_TALMA